MMEEWVGAIENFSSHPIWFDDIQIGEGEEYLVFPYLQKTEVMQKITTKHPIWFLVVRRFGPVTLRVLDSPGK